MRRLVVTMLMLALLSATAMAESAVKKDDFVVRASALPTKVDSWIFVKGGKPVYNVSLKFSNVPDGIKLKEDNTKIVPYITPASMFKLTWKAIAEANKTYNLTDAFEVTSWDNSVSLTAFLIKDNVTTNETVTTGNPEVSIYGKTDGEEFCDYMRSLPGEENNSMWSRDDVCRVKIRINNDEPFYANESGIFFGKTKLTKHGINEINVTATDAGGNTNTVTLEVNYTGGVAEAAPTPPMDIMLVVIALVGLALVLGVVGGVVFFFMKKKPASKKKEKAEVGEKGVKAKPSKPIKELKKTPKGIEAMKKRKDELKKRLDELSEKKNLTTEEKEEKIRIANELDDIVDKLLANDEYLFKLEERAFKALVDAREGKPSKQIKEELIDEGYTAREISKIREFFVRGKK